MVDLVLTHPTPEGVTTDTDLLGDDLYSDGAGGVFRLVIEHQPDGALLQSGIDSTRHGYILSA